MGVKKKSRNTGYMPNSSRKIRKLITHRLRLTVQKSLSKQVNLLPKNKLKQHLLSPATVQPLLSNTSRCSRGYKHTRIPTTSLDQWKMEYWARELLLHLTIMDKDVRCLVDNNMPE